MTLRVGFLWATLGILGAQQIPPKAPPDDDVTAYLNERRAPALRAMAIDDLDRSGAASLSQAKYAEAEDTYRKLLDQFPSDAKGLRGLANVYIAEGRKDEAIRLLLAETARNRTSLEILNVLVDTAVRIGNYDLGLSALLNVPKGQATGSVFLRIADLYHMKGDLGPAITALRRAIALMPESEEAKLMLADDLAATGQNDQSAAIYRALLKTDPNDGSALLERFGELLADPQRNPAVLLACAELAEKRLPDNATAAYSLGLAYSHFQGTSKTAIPLFEKAVAKAPGVSRFHYEFAAALVKTGDLVRARAELQTALQCNPPDEEKAYIRTMLNQVDSMSQSGRH